MSEFYTKTVILCRSIISQRKLTIRYDRNKLSDPDKVLMETEELNNEFEKYRTSERGIAYFLKTNYEKLVSITTHSHGWENKVNRLKELYMQSSQMV